MTKQYRILERPRFEKESVYLAQYSWKFLWIFPIWRTYQEPTYGGTENAEFNTVEDAKNRIMQDAKHNAWYVQSEDRVIAAYQADANGNLVEI